MNVPDAPDGGARRDKDLPIRLCILNNQPMAPMAPTAYLTHTFRSLQQLQQQRPHHQNIMPPAVLVMILVLWRCDRQAVTVLISNE